MSLLRAGLVVRESNHNARFERATADPRASQERVLSSLTTRNAGTVFGREHGFATIGDPAEFARRVPVGDYQGFRPYVDRVVAGERGVLTTDPVVMFTTTSGTTAEPKLIPVTARWRDQMAALTRLWMYRALGAHPRFLDHKVLLIVGPAVEGHTSNGIPFGSLSGVTYQRLPRLVRRSYAVPYAVALVKDPETRYFLTMRLALGHAVSVVATPNPTSLLRLAETSTARGEEIVRAVYDGTLGISTQALADDDGRHLAALLGRNVGADRERARFLEAVVARHGALLPWACWPDLDLIGCWLGGAAALHAERLHGSFGPRTSLRDLGLLASEGRMTVPVADATPAGPLAVHANYYEFVPEDDIDKPEPPVLGAHELESGQRYFILLTGGNGLYRYHINDVVEVVGFHRATPSVAFVRKGRDMVSITGEKLHVNHLQSALRRASQETGLEIVEFRLVPDAEGLRHDLLVELHGGQPDHQALVAFVAAVDRHLQADNREYRSKRTSRRLGPPRLFVMRPGWSEELCRADFRGGRRESQHKWRAMGMPWNDDSRASVITRVD